MGLKLSWDLKPSGMPVLVAGIPARGNGACLQVAPCEMLLPGSDHPAPKSLWACRGCNSQAEGKRAPIKSSIFQIPLSQLIMSLLLKRLNDFRVGRCIISISQAGG